MSTQPTRQEFTAFCHQHKDLALAICEARAFAEVERERVNSYILPIFQRYGLTEPEDCGKGDTCRRHRHGKPIDNSEHLYLCEDKEKTAAYYAACDTAHRAHGVDGPSGHCPALTAEHELRKAEWALRDVGCELFGLDGHPYGKDGADRKKMLDLLMGACLKVPLKKAAESTRGAGHRPVPERKIHVDDD